MPDYDKLAAQFGAAGGDKYDKLAAQYSAKLAESDDAAQARAYIENGRKARGDAAFKSGRQTVDDLVGGAAMGISDVGNTTLNAASYLPGKLLPGVAQWSRTRNADFDAITEQNKDSAAFKGSRLTTNIGATLPMGGTLAAGLRGVAPLAVRAGASAPVVEGLANAVGSAGFSTRMPAATTFVDRAADLGIRAAGGAINGGASAGLINPSDAGRGALLGGALPPGLSAIGGTGAYLGRTAKSLVQPFTKNGQEDIAAKILSRFGEGGPMSVNANEIVAGSKPTLAEATGNAGIAGLQRTARDLRPNAFQAREAQNASALTSSFDSAAGDVGQLEFYKAQRADAAKTLYDQALNRVPEPVTPWLKGQITQLLKRPSIDEASRTAQKWAIERGEKPYMNGSLAGLHDVKTALDDKIAAAVQGGQGGEAKALQATQDKLLTVMEKMSPDYAEARATYAAMSKPINEMEALQGLNVTDKMGSITLAKIQNAIKGLQNQRMQAGFNNAKSVDEEKLKTLLSIRDDLLRKESTNAGKSAGSNTFQNIATDNILGTMLPGKLGGMVNSRVGDVVGQVGKLAYSGANEKIRNNLLDMMLDPALAQSALNKQSMIGGPSASRLGGLLESSYPWAYRSAPALATDR